MGGPPGWRCVRAILTAVSRRPPAPLAPRAAKLGLIPILLLLGACGGSSPPPLRSGAEAAPPRTRSVASPASPSPSGGAGLGSSPRAGTTEGSPTGGATGVRLPATFVIRAGGRLDPPSVSSPASLPVDLTVVSGDGERHRVLLRTPVAHGLTVPAHGQASVLLRGLRAGRYELEIDRVPSGALVIGGEPGP